ncbi:Peroxiredoxin [Balamuthia mandrillaris]
MMKSSVTLIFLAVTFVVMGAVTFQATRDSKSATTSSSPILSIPSFIHFRSETPEEFLSRRQAPQCDDFDCFGICGGTAVKDCLGVCNGTAVEDCNGICNGNAVLDCNGVCNGPDKEDCTGQCGGRSFTDCHGRCGGPSVRSCEGVCMAPCSDPEFGRREFRSIDGSGNNQLRTQMGQARRPTFHFANFHYEDGISVPRGGNPTRLPSARAISNAVFNRAEPTTKEKISLMTMAWGQLIDHDLTATPVTSPCDDSFRIEVPRGDPRFDPQSRGGVTMQFCRSLAGMTPREQRTDVTTWIDASFVYGSDPGSARLLRTGQGGRLRASADGRFLPMNTLIGVDMSNTEENVPGDNVFAAGDGRANENVMLTTLQVLFMREHNRFVDSHIFCTGGNPAEEDELRYQMGRKWVYSLVEHITYDEFLPALFGEPLEPYVAYNPQADGSMSIEFSTAGYRMGHSAAPTVIPLLDNDGNEIRNGSTAAAPLRLSDNYFNPPMILEFDIGPFLKGLSETPMNKIDAIIVPDLRDRLFRVLDLVAINIQRGRDHGIAGYNDMREAYGLPRCDDYECISSEGTTAAALREAYGPGNIDDVDAYAGGLAEDHENGAAIGPLFKAILKEQFIRLRDADRFWYENDQWTPEELEVIKNTKLSDIIERNTGFTNLPDNVFTMV